MHRHPMHQEPNTRKGNKDMNQHNAIASRSTEVQQQAECRQRSEIDRHQISRLS
ncbi:hypothetical protein BJX96DRAFT_48333 [Aspergillus floccosus]